MTTGEKIVRIECDRKFSKESKPLGVTRLTGSETVPLRDGGLKLGAVPVEFPEEIVALNVEEVIAASRRSLCAVVIVGLSAGLSAQQVVATVHVGVYGTPVVKEFAGRVGGRSPRITASATFANSSIL